MMRARIWLPLAALALVLVVVGVNVLAGGPSYGPDRPADPCRDRKTGAIEPELGAVAQRVVLTGLDESACRLDITRERLLLALASPQAQEQLVADLAIDRDELAETLSVGLNAGIARLERNRELPPVSALLPDILDELDLPGPVKTLAEQLPSSAVDGLLPTGPVLRRAAENVDYGKLLTELDDPDDLEPLLRDAIRQGAIDEARVRLRDKLAGGLGDLF